MWMNQIKPKIPTEIIEKHYGAFNNKKSLKHNSNMPQSKTLDFCLAVSDSLCLSAVFESKCRWELFN